MMPERDARKCETPIDNEQPLHGYNLHDLPGWTPPTKTPGRLWLKALIPNATPTLTLSWTGCMTCQDSVVLTTRKLWTTMPFPQMTFTASNVVPVVDNPAPKAGTGRLSNGQFGPGFGPPPSPAIEWNTEVTVQSNGNDVSCNEFTVGVIQNMRNFNATFVYSDGTRIARGLLPSLDQVKQHPGPVPFYSTSSVRTLAACGSTGSLHFEDTPKAYSTWFNSCPNTSGSLQSVTFEDSLETWLVARHNPSGCFTVLKHFTWNQNAETDSVFAAPPPVGQIIGNGATNVSPMDNGPGQAPVLNGQAWNATVGSGVCQ